MVGHLIDDEPISIAHRVICQVLSLSRIAQSRLKEVDETASRLFVEAAVAQFLFDPAQFGEFGQNDRATGGDNEIAAEADGRVRAQP